MRSRTLRTAAPERAQKSGSRGADATIGAAGALGRFKSPLYHQIYLILRQRIADGEFDAEGTLPSEQELGEFHGVSRITAKRALDELATDGLVVRERGRGTRLVEKRRRVRISGRGTGELDPLLAMGGETEVAVMEFGYDAATPDVAETFGLQVGTPVQRAVRVRSIGGDPFSHLTTYVPEAFGRTYGRDDMAEMPLLSLLTRAGATPANADQAVSATLADTVVAQRLNVDVGAPLLRIRRVLRDLDGRPIELLVALYRSDIYQLTMTLSSSGDPTKEWSADAVTGTPSGGGWRSMEDAGG